MNINSVSPGQEKHFPNQVLHISIIPQGGSTTTNEILSDVSLRFQTLATDNKVLIQFTPFTRYINNIEMAYHCLKIKCKRLLKNLKSKVAACKIRTCEVSVTSRESKSTKMHATHIIDSFKRAH